MKLIIQYYVLLIYVINKISRLYINTSENTKNTI